MIDETLKARVTDAFTAQFGESPERYFQAPGRVNLIGEHTDYNDGFVLPCAINFQTLVAVSPRADDKVNVVSVDYEHQVDSFSLSEEIKNHETQMWSNYIRGVIKHLKLRGLELGGVDMAVSGNVPQGAGLSSSASLEVVIGEAFRQLNALPISKEDVALNGQAAENQFVGCACGIMDQMVSAIGQQGHAILLDCRSLETMAVPMPDDLTVMIINSNVKRGLVDSEYNTRREQCEAAAKVLGVDALRDADLRMLEEHREQMSSEEYRRARHVISENMRTLEAAEALREGDIKALSSLMRDSHISMRDDFEITVAPIDYAVSMLDEYLGDRGGVRMTGGGFGGCIVALMPRDLVDGAAALLRENYQARTGYQESLYLCSAEAGAGEAE